MYLLFTTNTCPNCKTAKSMIEADGVQYELVNASTPNGLELARKYKISHVPTLLELDADNNVLKEMNGVQEIEGMLEKII